MVSSRNIDVQHFTYQYSICTLVSNKNQYQDMLKSFETAGFSEKDCEFLYIDNSAFNQYDAYSGLNQLITAAQGQYIILCHQDISLNYDKRSDLDLRIKEMNQIDSHWAVLGNSGGIHFNKGFTRISDPFGQNRTVGKLPGQVASLDENFLILKKSANLGLSRNLSGFHLYGTDICLIANTLGYRCYVIDFHLTHQSDGSGWKDIQEACARFLKKYQQAFSSRFINTNCAKLFISGSKWKNKIFNHIYITRKIKRLYKLKIKMTRLGTLRHKDTNCFSSHS